MKWESWLQPTAVKPPSFFSFWKMQFHSIHLKCRCWVVSWNWVDISSSCVNARHHGKPCKHHTQMCVWDMRKSFSAECWMTNIGWQVGHATPTGMPDFSPDRRHLPEGQQWAMSTRQGLLLQALQWSIQFLWIWQGSWSMGAWDVEIEKLFVLWVRKFKSDLQSGCAEEGLYPLLCSEQSLFCLKGHCAMTHTAIRLLTLLFQLVISGFQQSK